MADPNTPVPQPSEQVVNRLLADHQRDLDGYSEYLPGGICHGRPDLRAKLVAEAEARFEALFDKYGIQKPVPKTPEALREERFNQQWSGGLGDSQVALMREEWTREQKLDGADRRANVAALVKEYGKEKYDQMVTDAKAAMAPGERFDEAAASNRFVLLNLAALGRYNQARSRARTAAGLR